MDPWTVCNIFGKLQLCIPLEWRHNGRDGASNHRRLDCLLNRSFGKENIKAPRHWLFVRGIHRLPVDSPHKGPVTWKMFPFDDVIIHRITKQKFQCQTICCGKFGSATLLAKKVVTPPLKTIKPMWIELLCFHLAEIGMIWTRDCSPTKSDTTLGRHSMQGQVGSSSSETTVYVVVPPNQSSHCDNFESIFAYFFKSFSDCSNNGPSNPYGY